MFEDTLLIIKSDYLHKRKMVLLRLLEEGFQIEGKRRLLFSPEHAGEFYATISEEKNYMLQVIELSKGVCKAYILTKEKAIEELLNTMVCYFTNSKEMEKMVHASKCAAAVQREISYIFPNYIHEPVPWFERHKFGAKPLPSGLSKELYDIIRTVDPSRESWKVRVAEWCMRSNKDVPIISHECSVKPFARILDEAEQTSIKDKTDVCSLQVPSSSRRSVTTSSGGSSGLISSSSCITCSSLGSHGLADHISPSEILRKRTIPLSKGKPEIRAPSPEGSSEESGEAEAAPEAVREEVEPEYVMDDSPVYGYIPEPGADICIKTVVSEDEEKEAPPVAVEAPVETVDETKDTAEPEAGEEKAEETVPAEDAEVAPQEAKPEVEGAEAQPAAAETEPSPEIETKGEEPVQPTDEAPGEAPAPAAVEGDAPAEAE